MKKEPLYLVVFLLVAYLCGVPTAAFAGPACDRPFTITQPDGTKFVAMREGDERLNYVRFGQLAVVKDAGGFWHYAEVAPAGLKALEAKVAIDPAPSTAATIQDVAAMAGVAVRETLKSQPAEQAVPSSAATSPEPALVILAQFGNQFFFEHSTTAQSYWADKVFGTSGKTVRTYFHEVSGTRFHFTPAAESCSHSNGADNDGVVLVTIWTQHPNPGTITDDRNRQIVREALIAADPYVDFASLDADLSGSISQSELHIIVVVAGYETAYGTSNGDPWPGIWAHYWALGGAVLAPELDGVLVGGGGYAQIGELHCDEFFGWHDSQNVEHRATIGVLCHELGHGLGLPDLYDTDMSSFGIGVHGLMGYGCWGEALGDSYIGETPVHMCAWSKFRLGWLVPKVISEEGDTQIQQATSGDSIILPTQKAKEYYLAENRELKNFDAGLYRWFGGSYPGGGVAMWHIDESRTNNDDETHKLVDLEEANEPVCGRELDIKANWGNRHQYFWAGGDQDQFTDSTIPNTSLYDGQSTGIRITAITAPAETMYMHVVPCPYSTGQLYRFAMKWGKTGSEPGDLASPEGVAVDALGNVYVADRSKARVLKFSRCGVFLWELGSLGSEDSQFDYPRGVAVSGSHLYVADTNNCRIKKYTLSGVFVGWWGKDETGFIGWHDPGSCHGGVSGTEDGALANPADVALNSAGTEVFVADTGNDRIQVFTATGAYQRKWGGRGSANGQFKGPPGLAVAGGYVHVADRSNHRIQTFTTAGAHQISFGYEGLDDLAFSSPEKVCVDNDGNIYVSDTGAYRWKKYTSTGDLVGWYGRDGEALVRWHNYPSGCPAGYAGSGDGEFGGPKGIAVTPEGNVYIADKAPNSSPRIQKFWPTTDSDGDWLPDAWEQEFFGDLSHSPDEDDDTGGPDGLTNAQECFASGTDPTDGDTDDDALPDGWEVDHALDPLRNDAAEDPDTDSLTNLEEHQHGTDPNDSDSDDDGLSDSQEVGTYDTSPTNADTDYDGLLDGDEVNTHGTDPLNADTDDDNLTDGEEVYTYGTDPNTPDGINDIYWDDTAESVTITFTSLAGAEYVLEYADADGYADSVTWNPLPGPPVTGMPGETTVTDDLSDPSLAHAFRFYRVKRADETYYTRQTAGVFGLDLPIGWTMQDFFISTPLIPDEDHASVQAVIGTQINRNLPNIRQRVADTGINNRMVYNRNTKTWSADVGEAFDIAAGEGYRLFAGGGIAQTIKVRLTGYVPEEALSVLAAKPGWTQTNRWLAYSMPRPRTLDTLGLHESVTGWNNMNTLKLRPLGASVWSTYKWDGSKWYDVTAPGVDAGSTPIACGEAVVFTRFGTPVEQDVWSQPTWYDHPPND